MEFSGVTIDTASQVTIAVNHILGLNISPVEKRVRIDKVIKKIGQYFHNQLYMANSQVFDSVAIASVGLNEASAQSQRLADKIVRNYSLSRSTDRLILSYYNSILGQAQSEAFSNAISMQRHPTLRRELVGEYDCKLCIGSEGEHMNPGPEEFKRHTDCDCLFIVGGYNTRNGVLKNYNKKG